MIQADWNAAVIDLLADEAATLVFSSRRISQYLFGYNPDWRAWFKQRLCDVFLNIQAVGGVKTTPSELHEALEKCSDQKKGGISIRVSLDKVSLYWLS